MTSTSIDSRAVRGLSGTRPGSHWLQRLGAAAVIVVLLARVADYPYAAPFLVLALAAYAGLIAVHRGAWLLGLPAILPLLNLAPWSGRYFFEEFDFFVLATIAVALWQSDYRRRRRSSLNIGQAVPLLVFAGSYLVSLARGLLPLDAPDANAFYSYYSHYNALRVGRGLLWPLLLLPPLLAAFSEDRARAERYLATGIVAGLFGTGLVVLWERGVLADFLYGRNRYEVLRNLLNFSTPYRVTALFSEMHTGGEAIDGYLALTLPFAAVGLSKLRSPLLFRLSLAALPLGFYAAVTTFSRGLYLALVVIGATVVWGAAAHWRGRAAPRSLWGGVLGAVVAALLAALAFRQGGTMALAFVLLAWFGAAALGHRRAVLEARVWGVGLAGIALFGIAMILRAQLTSKWLKVEYGEAWGAAVGLGLAACASGVAAGSATRGFLSFRALAVAAVFMGSCLGTVVPSVLGSRMEARFAGAGMDLANRAAHWRHAVGLMEKSWDVLLFGLGLGVYPRVYVLDRELDAGGTFAFRREADNTYLQLGGGQDLRFGQRLNLAADRSYILSFDYRTAAPEALLRVRFCRRHIIHPTEWNPDCKVFEKVVKSTGGRWEHIRWPFEIGGIGAGGRWGRPPLLIEVMNRREYAFMFKPPALVDLDNVRVGDWSGADFIANGDFEGIGDRWFPYYDFNHLPWHIKNLWVDLYFEQGGVGVLGFLGLAGCGLGAGLRGARRGDGFALAAAASILGFLTVGWFGTLLDVPRVSLLFFLVLFAMLPKRDRCGQSGGKPAN
jgi:hypothetical protein